MRYLLDSDVIIDFLKDKGPGASLLPELIDQNNLYISVVSWMEIAYGIKKISKTTPESRQFDLLLRDLSIEILAVDVKTADRFIDLKLTLEKQGNPLSDFDLLIASATISNNLTLVTRNREHFKRIKNLKLYDITSSSVT